MENRKDETTPAPKKQVRFKYKLSVGEYIQVGQYILNGQTPTIPGLFNMRFRDAPTPTPGGSALYIIDRDKDKPFESHPVFNIPAHDFAKAKLDKPIEVEPRKDGKIPVIKVYLIGHCDKGTHYISGTGGKWSVNDYADFLSQNLVAPPAGKKMKLRLSVIACYAGKGSGSQPSFARALFDALRARLHAKGINNVELETVARPVPVARASTQHNYQEQNKSMIIIAEVEEKGQKVVREIPITVGSFSDLNDTRELNEVFNIGEEEEGMTASQTEEKKSEARLAEPRSSSPHEVKSQEESKSQITPFTGNGIHFVDCDGILTRTAGEDTLNSHLYSLLLADGDSLKLKSYDEVRRIMEVELNKPENAQFRLRPGALNYLQGLLATGDRVCILSENQATYIKALLSFEGMKEEDINKLLMLDRHELLANGGKGQTVENVLAVTNVKVVNVVEDDPEHLADITSHIQHYYSIKGLAPKINFLDKIPKSEEVLTVSPPVVEKKEAKPAQSPAFFAKPAIDPIANAGRNIEKLLEEAEKNYPDSAKRFSEVKPLVAQILSDIKKGGAAPYYQEFLQNYIGLWNGVDPIIGKAMKDSINIIFPNVNAFKTAVDNLETVLSTTERKNPDICAVVGDLVSLAKTIVQVAKQKDSVEPDHLEFLQNYCDMWKRAKAFSPADLKIVDDALKVIATKKISGPSI